MSNKQFISNLSATYADVRKLDVKKINLKGKDILEYIKENGTVILDYRGTNASDLDIVGSNVTVDNEGNVIIDKCPKKAPAHFFIYFFPGTPFPCELQHIDNCTEEQAQIIRGAAKIENGEVFDEYGNHLMYWDTTGFSNGDYGNDYTYGAFIGSNITSFKSDLSSLTNGQFSFGYSKLAEFSGDLSNLETARGMFSSCSNLTTFNSDLTKLTNGSNMFGGTKLTSFNSDLPSLTEGGNMFSSCSNLTSFNIDLPSLTNAYGMFYSCTELESFTSDLSTLNDGGAMFEYCTKLTSFNSDLSSLQNGYCMFDSCKLDAQSVSNIIHFIPQRDAKPTATWGNGNITIGISITNTDAAKQAFAKECDCDSWDELNKEFDDKNWAVVWQFNGAATTFDLRAERPSTAVYTRLEEVFMPTEEEIAAAQEKGEHIETPHYEYISQDGDNYYNIHWYHDSNTNNEGYDYFESLEMATLAYSVIPKA